MSYLSAALSHRRMSAAIMSAAGWLYWRGESVPRRYAAAFRQISACLLRADLGADFGSPSRVAAWHDARYAATIFQCIASFSIDFMSVTRYPPNQSPEPTTIGAVSAFVKPQIIVRFESTVAQLSTLGIAATVIDLKAAFILLVMRFVVE